MTQYLPMLTGSIGVLLTLCGFGFFLDKIVRPGVKKTIYNRMNRAIFEESDSSVLFKNMFDYVFRVRTLGRPALNRSLFASYVVFFSISAIWAISYPERLDDLPSTWESLIAVLFFVLLLNPIGDFLSLWQTRLVVAWMAKLQTNWSFFLLLVSDLILTILVFGAAAVLWQFLLPLYTSLLGYITGDLFYIKELYCRYTFTCDGSGMIFVGAATIHDLIFILLCTTMLTSIWLWTFVIGVLLWPMFKWLNHFIKVENYPMGTAMIIGALIVSPILFFIGIVVVSFFRS